METWFEDIDLEETIENAARFIRERAREAELKLTINLAPKLPKLHADERLIKQILINLLNNAVKFTPAGGNITVEVSLPTSGGMQIEIVDTGIGMNASDIPVALEAFQQVGKTSTKAREGTGLGLRLVQSLMELHDGVFELESELGVGTVARLVFRAASIR